MSTRLSKCQEFESRLFAVGEITGALRAVIQRYAKDAEKVRFAFTQVLPDGTRSTRRELPVSELETVCKLEHGSIETSFDLDDESKLFLSMDELGGGNVTVHASSERGSVVGEVLAAIQTSLALQTAETALEQLRAVLTSKRASLPDLADRLEAVETALFSPARKLRCFLSYRFAPDTDIVALRLQQFFALVDVEVLTGANYEPRTIQEKVLSKLREELDFVVLLINEAGESMWTRDEIASALHRGIAVVPLVENGSKFDRGLFGDIEYISFEKGHIGDTFIKLLEALRFIRAQHSAKTEGGPGTA